MLVPTMMPSFFANGQAPTGWTEQEMVHLLESEVDQRCQERGEVQQLACASVKEWTTTKCIDVEHAKFRNLFPVSE